MRVTVALSVLLMSPAASAAGQSFDLSSGQRVRITAPSLGLKKEVATVSEVRGDTIVLSSPSGSQTIAIENITGLDVSTGARTEIVRFGLIGFAAGATVGAIVGVAAHEPSDLFTPAATGAVVGAVYGAVGLLAGGLIGSLQRTDRWRAVRIVRLTGALRPIAAGRIGFSFSRAF
jgi:hypothetical protein